MRPRNAPPGALPPDPRGLPLFTNGMIGAQEEGTGVALSPRRSRRLLLLSCLSTKVRRDRMRKNFCLILDLRITYKRPQASIIERGRPWRRPQRHRGANETSPSPLLHDSLEPQELWFAPRRQDRKGKVIVVVSSWRSSRLSERPGFGCGRRSRWVLRVKQNQKAVGGSRWEDRSRNKANLDRDQVSGIRDQQIDTRPLASDPCRASA
jgi:hypothetical protein